MQQAVAYYRVSTTDQSIESQRHAMGGDFDNEFTDQGVSGAVPAAERPGFAAMLKTISSMRKKPELCVYAVDRLGRDSIDVQTTVRDLRALGVRVNIHGLGTVEGDTGELLLTLLAQFAQMERNRIKARADAGREMPSIVLVVVERQAHVLQVRETGRLARLLPRPAEDREQDRCQDGDDGYHYEQLNQCEGMKTTRVHRNPSG